jgi:Protein of unknown function (DUF2911)
MKKVILLLAVLLFTMTAEAQIDIPALSPAGIVKQQIGLGNATISYSRPSLRGRKMLGTNYIPFGTVWRFGANTVTTLELDEDMLIEGKPLAKGKYAMVVIPGESEWTIIINNDANQWGVYGYKEDKDVLRFKVKAERLDQTLETMSLTFEDVKPTSSAIVFRWEKTTLKFVLSQDVDARVMADIKAKTSKPKPSEATLMESAEYYLFMNRDLEQALIWSNQVLEMTKSPFRYNLKAQIAEKLGKCGEATEAAKGAIEYAEKNGDVAAITLAKRIIKVCEDK